MNLTDVEQLAASADPDVTIGVHACRDGQGDPVCHQLLVGATPGGLTVTLASSEPLEVLPEAAVDVLIGRARRLAEQHADASLGQYQPPVTEG